MRFWYNPNFLVIVALLLLSIPALKSLAIPGFYTSHDGETHVARIAQYYQALADGQFPPRFAGSFYNGLGSPIFVYIYPLPYLLGSLIHTFGFSFTDSFEAVMALGFIFSALFSYFWLKEVFKSEKAAFLGALFYVWVPYRFSLIYVRASISEHLAYTFLPLILYSFTKLKEKQSLLWISSGAIFFALVLLSQNLVAMISLPIIGGYILVLGIWGKSLKYLLKSAISIAWGFAIASVTYIPSLFEMKFVRFKDIISSTYDNHFVTLRQLIRSPWGYGFDLSGTVNDEMSFQVGLAHLLILVLAILLFFYFLLQRFSYIKRIGRKYIENVQSYHLVLSLFFLTGLIFSVLIMLEIHLVRLIWQNIKFLNLIDIPWRFLGIAVLAMSFLTAFVAKSLKPGFLFLFLIIAVLIANRNHLRINKTQILDDDFFKNYTGHATQYSEFTPKWRQTVSIPIGFDPQVKTEVISGEAKINNIRSKSNQISFEAAVISPIAQLRINKFFFPGVKVSVDNELLTSSKDLIIPEFENSRLKKEQDSTGVILINLEKGSHQVTAEFGETRLRLFADYLSLGSLVLAIGFVVKNVKK